MANTIRVYSEDPDDILATGNYGAGALSRVQWCATETGVFADVGTVVLVTATRAYTIYHTTGTATTWYRTRYENSGGTQASDWSPVFQVGGEEAGYLCSLADVRQRIVGLAASDTSPDEDLAEFIRAVSEQILAYTGREFVGTPAAVTRTFDVSGTTVTLWIPGGVRSVTTLGLASGDQPDTAGTYTTTTSYYLRPLPHERSAGWPATRVETGSGVYFSPGRSTVQIVGTFGWAEVPPTIGRIAADAVVAMYGALSSGSTGRITTDPGTGSLRFLRYIPKEDRELLDSYRDIVVL
jgi:hypothetical protein